MSGELVDQEDRPEAVTTPSHVVVEANGGGTPDGIAAVTAGSMSGEIRVLHECAKRAPRDPERAVRAMLATLRTFPALAEIGTYAIPYKDHTDECKSGPWKQRLSCRCPITWVRGPSIELMVPVATEWGNNIHGARLDPRGQETLVQGIYIDVEKLNFVLRDRQVSRLKRKRDGSTFWLGQDEYWKEVEIQASKMHRNAIKRGIPRYVWQPIYDVALEARLAKEAGQKIEARWKSAVAKFASKGITAEDLLARLNIESEAALTPSDMVNVGSLWNAAEAGLVNLRELFGVPDDPDATEAKAPRGRATTTEEP